jgi:hypothetical protein
VEQLCSPSWYDFLPLNNIYSVSILDTTITSITTRTLLLNVNW